MRVLITGAAGRIGTVLRAGLCDEVEDKDDGYELQGGRNTDPAYGGWAI